MKKAVLIITLLATCSIVRAQGNGPKPIVSEDFSSYKNGTFPKEKWNDIIDISIPVTAPNPSSEVIKTKGPNGKRVKALQFKRAVSTSAGFYKKIDPAESIYRIESDVRIDNWSNSSRAFFTDWAVAFGVLSLVDNVDFNGGPQITFVANPVNENWVIYALRSDVKAYSEYFNIEFEDKIDLNVWYHIEFELNNKTGLIKTKVTESETGKVTHNKETQIPNWNSEKSGNYDHIGAWDGEYNTDATLGNQATITNFEFYNRKKH